MPNKSANNVKETGVKIQLDKERTMLFDLNAFCELEEHYGTLDEALDGLKKMSFKSIRKLLHASLVHEDEALTEKAVGKFVNIENMSDIATKISEAFNNSSPEIDEEVKNV